MNEQYGTIPDSNGIPMEEELDKTRKRTRTEIEEEEWEIATTASQLDMTETPVPVTERVQLPTRYPVTAPGPYYVLIESKTGALHPMTLAEYLLKIGVKFSDLSKKGINRVRVTCTSATEANQLLDCPRLESFSLKAFPPSSALSRKGTIHGLAPNTTADQLMQCLVSPCPVANIRMFSRPNDNEASAEITFVGIDLPKFVRVYGLSCPVRPSIPRPLICYYCGFYGHTAAQCASKNKPGCVKCAEKHPMIECKQTVRKCLHCQGPHAANDTSCPKFKEQQARKRAAFQQGVLGNDNWTSSPLRGNEERKKQKKFSTNQPVKSNTIISREFSKLPPNVLPEEDTEYSHQEKEGVIEEQVEKPSTSSASQQTKKNNKVSVSPKQKKKTFAEVVGESPKQLAQQTANLKKPVPILGKSPGENQNAKGKRDGKQREQPTLTNSWEDIFRSLVRFTCINVMGVAEEVFAALVAGAIELFIASPLFGQLKNHLVGAMTSVWIA